MGSGGGKTTTVQSNSPPQLLNEGREGYERTNEFYRGILENPPVYEGERVAPFSPAQSAALEQQRGYFGVPQQFQLNAEQQISDTASGAHRWADPIIPGKNYGLGYDGYGLTGESFEDLPTAVGGGRASGYSANIEGAQSTYNGDPRFLYDAMTDEEMQVAIRHASEPILADLEENIMPQIRDSSQLAGQGATSTRSDVARQKAVEGYGRTVGSSVIGPLMQQREALTQDFDKAMQSYLQATAEGDANRATQAQVEMARINAASHDNASQINAQKDIAGSDLALRAAEGSSRERMAGAGLKSQERQTGAGLESQDMNAYSERNLRGYDADRNRELTAAGMSGKMLQDEAFRINQLFQSGMIDQQQYQRMLDSAREVYEEPLYRQSQAAQALSGMSGLGPGSATSVNKESGGDDGTMQAIMMVAGIAAKAIVCSKDFKDGIESIQNKKELVEDVLNLEIQKWHYKWDVNTKHLGPILEDCPSWLYDKTPKHLDLLNLVSGLVLTIQAQNKRIENLEHVLSNS